MRLQSVKPTNAQAEAKQSQSPSKTNNTTGRRFSYVQKMSDCMRAKKQGLPTRTRPTLPRVLCQEKQKRSRRKQGFLNRTCADLRHGRHAGSRRKDAPETDSLTRIPTVSHSTRVQVRARTSELGLLVCSRYFCRNSVHTFLLEAINSGITLNLDFGFNHTISGVDLRSRYDDSSIIKHNNNTQVIN